MNHPKPPIFSGELARATAEIQGALAASQTSAVRLAAKNVARLRAERGAVREELRAMIAERSRPSRPGERGPSDEAVEELGRRDEELAAAVADARAAQTRIITEMAPSVAAALLPHVAVVGSLVDDLLGALELACDPLTEAAGFLAEHKIESIPRLVRAAPVLTSLLRQMRLVAGGR